jgi:hypothetical protein
MAKTRNYYKEIDDVLIEYENYKPWHTRNIDWACDRIEWCWKWKKITREQMEELTDRAIAIYGENLFVD